MIFTWRKKPLPLEPKHLKLLLCERLGGRDYGVSFKKKKNKPQHVPRGSLAFRKQYRTFHCRIRYFQTLQWKQTGSEVQPSHESSYRHVDKLLLKNKGRAAASLRTASISSALADERSAECPMEPNQRGVRFTEDMSQRLKVALIRVLILSLNLIYSSLTLNYNLCCTVFLGLWREPYSVKVLASFYCVSLLKTELLNFWS